MKKLLLFLTLSFIYLLGANLTVNAATESFYEAETISNIYMVRYNKQTKDKYYQQARLYRRSKDNKAAYCLQPFRKFDPQNNIYETVDEYQDISKETLNRIKDIIGFGYNYQGHNSYNWYAATQMLIWKTVDPNNDFYFTKTLNGEKVELFTSEMNMINNLINESYTLPSFSNQTFYGITNRPFTITDTNNIIPFFAIPDDNDFVVKNNTLTITKKNPGCYEREYTRYLNYDNESVLFYYNKDTQNLATAGSPDNRTIKVKYCVQNLNLKIKKINKDTKSTKSLGEASLKDTTFKIYNSKMQEMATLSLDDNYELNLNSDNTPWLTYGTYYLKESKTGTGYLPNDTTYKIEFTKDNYNINLIIENEVIKKDVIIKKYFGNGKLMEKEANVKFQVFDKDGNMIKEIVTDSNGTAKITLPYGHYKFVQLTTTEGYSKIEPFKVFINDINKTYYYKINDYKEEKPNDNIISIEVPNTNTKDYTSSFSIIILGLYLAKKKFS